VILMILKIIGNMIAVLILRIIVILLTPFLHIKRGISK